ncbi:MAG: S1C family serine protease [Geminicoccaceae bacterium]
MINISMRLQAVRPQMFLRLGDTWLGLGIMIFAVLFAPPLLAIDQPAGRLAAIVQIDAVVPHNARTAEGLGTRRTGTGVVIDDDGLILTIGYVIMEAIEVSVRGPSGNARPADIVAYDHESGFGLIRTKGPIDVRPLTLGGAGELSMMEPLLVASKVGNLEAKGVYLVDRRPFAGYWEYLLEDALFTAPSHAQFGGAALINRQGELVGIGSLILNSGNPRSRGRPTNMFIPVDDLKPILKDLLADGRRRGPAHPWLGLFLEEYRGRIFVTRVAPDGPGQDAGMTIGDLILGIDGAIANGLADFYRDLWRQGEPGVDISLDVVRDDEISPTVVKSGDRYRYLRLDPTF